MPLNEPRIFEHKPKWLKLEEIERTNTVVWFKTRTGRLCVPLKDVEQWRNRNGKRGKVSLDRG